MWPNLIIFVVVNIFCFETLTQLIYFLFWFVFCFLNIFLVICAIEKDFEVEKRESIYCKKKFVVFPLLERNLTGNLKKNTLLRSFASDDMLIIFSNQTFGSF
jgi:hypothetical protein